MSFLGMCDLAGDFIVADYNSGLFRKTIVFCFIGLVLLSGVGFCLTPVPEPGCWYDSDDPLCIYDSNDAYPASELSAYANTGTGFDLPITIKGYNFDGPVKVHLRVVDCDGDIIGVGPSGGYGPIYDPIESVSLHLDSGASGNCAIEVYTTVTDANGNKIDKYMFADEFYLEPTPGSEIPEAPVGVLIALGFISLMCASKVYGTMGLIG